MRLRSEPPRRSAFTLIELLVVVAIIALLISILLPSLSRAKKQAKLVKDTSQLADIGKSLMSYSIDYGRLPHQNTTGTAVPRTQRVAVGMWGYEVHKALANYMGGLRESQETQQRSKTHPVFYCPFVPENQIDFVNQLSGPNTGLGIENAEDVYMHITYSYFGRLDEVQNDPQNRRPWEPVDEPVPPKRQHYAGKIPGSDDVLMADTIMLWGGGGKWRINHGAGWTARLNTSNMNKPPLVEGANELFGDGHAKWLTRNRFPELVGAPNFGEIKKNATLDAGVDSLWW